MNTIKFLKDNYIQLNQTIYKPYTICNLPNSFGTEITDRFKYKGFTYIAE